jgi:Lipocalin-like domain
VTANERTPYGASPQGSMFLDAAGNFSIIVVSSGDARSVAYFGTYTVSETDKLMSLHIVDSTGGGSPNAAGRDLKRLVVLSGDELTIQNQTPAGAPGNIKLTWKRAN